MSRRQAARAAVMIAAVLRPGRLESRRPPTRTIRSLTGQLAVDEDLTVLRLLADRFSVCRSCP